MNRRCGAIRNTDGFEQRLAWLARRSRCGLRKVVCAADVHALLS
jgi:hypothetical protein